MPAEVLDVPDSETPTRSKPSRRGWKLLAIALLAVVGGRLFVVDTLTVQTDSMAPLLEGDPVTGDRVAIFRPSYWFSPPRRFDLVVFGADVDGASLRFVKRVVGLGGEDVQIRDGDLLVGGNLWRKDRSQFEELLVPVVAWDCTSDNDAFQFDRDQAQPSAEGLNWNTKNLQPTQTEPLRYGSSIGYPGHGKESEKETSLIGDIRLRIRFRVLEDGGRLELILREGVDAYSLELGTRKEGGGVSLNISKRKDDAFPGLETGVVYEIDFYNIDNCVAAFLDDRPLFDPWNYEFNKSEFYGQQSNGPEIRAKNMHIAIEEIRVDRDIHWIARGNLEGSHKVPEGHVLVLGDNSPDSRDSRDPEIGDVRLDQLLGCPVLVYYPFERARTF